MISPDQMTSTLTCFFLKPTREKAWLKTWKVAAGLSLALSSLTQAQNLQFAFDANGNLLAQTPASPAAPQILAQPQSAVVVPGELASFFVIAVDTFGLTYQWRVNGT